MGIFLSPCNAQHRAFFGVNAGWNANLFQIQPEDPYVQNGVRFFPLILGGNATLRITKANEFIEVGFESFNHFLWIKTFEEKIGFAPGFTRLSNFSIGLKKNIPLITNRLHLSLRSGGELALASGGGMIGTVTSSTSLGPLTYNVNLPIRRDRLIPFIYAGIGIETQFRNGMVLSLRATYHQGLRKIFDDEISYYFNNDPPTTLRFFTRGSHLPIQLGLAYPVSRIWEGKIEIE
jgi:hypothetical protein